MTEEEHHHHHHHHSGSEDDSYSGGNPDGESSHHHHHHSDDSEVSSPKDMAHLGSALCLFSSVLGITVMVIAACIAGANKEPPNMTMIWTAGVFAAITWIVGIFALLFQFHVRSRRVTKRLFFSFSIAAVISIYVIHSFQEHYKPLDLSDDEEETTEGATQEKQPLREIVPVDTSLYKPGWYGEATQNGVQLAFAAFAENAKESRDFNQRVSAPVSFATLTVINRSSSNIELPVLTVDYVMDTGSGSTSRPIRPLLLSRSDLNRDLLPIIKEPAVIRPGGMLPAIPVCQSVNFPWARVRAVKVRIGKTEVLLPGRIVTAEEKKEMVEKMRERQSASSAPTKKTTKAEDWYKGL